MKSYCSLTPLLDYGKESLPIHWENLFGPSKFLRVEIGFGVGEFLARNAQKYPQQQFVGIEQNWERIYKTLRRITRINQDPSSKQKVENIHILKIDARVAFERLFEQQSIDQIDCLFPCPWPKKGHIKHRLFSQAFLKLLNNRLKDQGRLKIVTDFEPYCAWIRGQIGQADFQSEVKKIQPQYDTKFERKWQAEGQEEFFELMLCKKKHVQIPKIKDSTLKSYKIKEFNPKNFEFIDKTADISVIFKDIFFDDSAQKAFVHVLVSEQHLVQHFRVAIINKGDGWRVCKMADQSFFPTPGIARALDLVHEAAQRSCS